ncbi:hypothetical protein B7486_15860 [cyanobacterium TDX16]|nr:hypothetical protein B7486_15860 [cyanobacterium TDX16]
MPFSIIQCGSLLIDGAIVGLVLGVALRREERVGRSPYGMRHAAAMIVIWGFLFALKIPCCRLLGVDAFGMLNLLYADLAIVVPGTAVVVLILASIRKHAGFRISRTLRIVCVGAMSAVPIAVFSSLVEPYRLEELQRDIIVSDERGGDMPIRLGVLADIQTDRVGEYERAAVSRLMSHRPDLILIAGDLFQGSREEFELQMDAIRGMLMPLDAPGGVFFVMGDVDWWREDQVRRALDGTRVRPLTDQIARLRVGDRNVTLGGIRLNYSDEGSRRVIAELETAPGSDDLRILLAHRPDVAFELSRDSRIDLIVAGHTHGGQVCFPFVGPLITLSDVPRDVAAGGLHEMSGNQIYVSRGVGHERGQAPRIRFLCPPEFSILTVLNRPAAVAHADQ